jgi:serine protease Do
VEAVRPAVVNIHGEKRLSAEEAAAAHLDADRRVNGMGTGIIVDPRGYILTNHHVIEGVQRIEITLSSGETLIGRAISRDPATDMALLKVDAKHPLPVITVGRSSDLMTGESVIAIGNAYGYEHTVTLGIISALHRSVEVGEGLRYEDLIQTDASINPGNSGGPLLNIDGAMIGVNVAVRAGAQGIGFAIPADRVLAIAAELMSVRRLNNAWHGMTTNDPVQPSDHGVRISHVSERSPAAQCGMQADDLIVKVNGQDIERSLDIERAMLAQKVGDEVSLEVRRGEERLRLPLVLAEAPAVAQDSTSDPVWDTIGLKLKVISSEQFAQYRSSYNGGLSVTGVRPDSPAAKQGIRAGDVLVGMHVWETVSIENVKYILSRPEFNRLEPMKFYILRGQDTLYGHITVPGRIRR